MLQGRPQGTDNLKTGEPMRPQAYILIVLMLPLIIGYQNCSSGALFGASSSGATAESGNGTGYEGKITYYRHYDSSNPCSMVGGERLPNDVLYAKSPREIYLTRKDCADIQPVLLSTITVTDAEHVSFEGKAFARFEPSAMAVAKSLCPAGRTEIAGAQRSNLLLDATNLTSSNWGANFPEIRAALTGSFVGQPNFEIARTNASPLDYQRLSQSTVLQPNTLYAYSLMARPGTSSSLRFNAFGSGVDLVSVWNLSTGASTYVGPGGLSDVSATSRALPEGGYFLTVYFRTNATMSLDIGTSSDTLNQGDSINVSSPQLESVDAFCAP